MCLINNKKCSKLYLFIWTFCIDLLPYQFFSLINWTKCPNLTYRYDKFFFCHMLLMQNIHWLYQWLISAEKPDWPPLEESLLLTTLFSSTRFEPETLLKGSEPSFHLDQRNIGNTFHFIWIIILKIIRTNRVLNDLVLFNIFFIDALWMHKLTVMTKREKK